MYPHSRSNMGVISRNFSTILGLLMVGFVIVNVQFGLAAPQYYEGAEASKLDVMKLFEPHCSQAEVEKELAEGNDSFCLGPVGEWNGADFLLLGEGIFILMLSLIHI